MNSSEKNDLGMVRDCREIRTRSNAFARFLRVYNAVISVSRRVRVEREFLEDDI
jgi:hypothetical protein